MHARIATAVLTGIAVFAAPCRRRADSARGDAPDGAARRDDRRPGRADPRRDRRLVSHARRPAAGGHAAERPADPVCESADGRQDHEAGLRLRARQRRAAEQRCRREAGSGGGRVGAVAEPAAQAARRPAGVDPGGDRGEPTRAGEHSEAGSGDAAVQDLGAAGTARSPERTTQHALEHGAVRERDRCDRLRRERAQGAHRCDCRLDSCGERHAAARGSGIRGLRLDDGGLGWNRRRRQLAQPVRHLGSGGHGVPAFGQGAHDRTDRSAHGRAAADVQHHSHAAARATETAGGPRRCARGAGR